MGFLARDGASAPAKDLISVMRFHLLSTEDMSTYLNTRSGDFLGSNCSTRSHTSSSVDQVQPSGKSYGSSIPRPSPNLSCSAPRGLPDRQRGSAIAIGSELVRQLI